MSPSANSAASSIRRVRVSTAHLFVWMAGIAIVLAGFRMVVPPPEQRGESRLWVLLLLVAVGFSLPLGAQVGSWLLWASDRLRGGSSLTDHPGHWILMTEGATVVAAWAAVALAMSLAARGIIEFHSATWFLMACGPALAMGLIGYARAWRCSSGTSRLWQAATLCLALQRGSFLLALAVLVTLSAAGRLTAGGLSPFLVGYGTVAIAGLGLGWGNNLLVLLAAFFDPRRSDRDFLHWSGVITLQWSFALLFPFIV